MTKQNVLEIEIKRDGSAFRITRQDVSKDLKTTIDGVYVEILFRNGPALRMGGDGVYFYGQGKITYRNSDSVTIPPFVPPEFVQKIVDAYNAEYGIEMPEYRHIEHRWNGAGQFQITKQTHKGDKFTPEGDTFRHRGWTLRSQRVPAFSPFKKLFACGMAEASDGKWVYVDAEFRQIVDELFAAYNRAFGKPEPVAPVEEKTWKPGDTFWERREDGVSGPHAVVSVRVNLREITQYFPHRIRRMDNLTSAQISFDNAYASAAEAITAAMAWAEANR